MDETTLHKRWVVWRGYSRSGARIRVYVRKLSIYDLIELNNIGQIFTSESWHRAIQVATGC